MDMRSGQPHLLLDGEWQFAFSNTLPSTPVINGDTLQQSGLTVLPATVPGNFELDLQANGLIEDPFFGMNVTQLRQYESAHVWYRKRFVADLKAVPQGYETVLLLEGVDCFADIYWNGVCIGQTENMLVEHTFPVTLQAENELLIHIRPTMQEAQKHPYNPSAFAAFPFAYSGLYVRKAPHMFGWDIMPHLISAGLWRSVRVLYLPKERLETVFLDTLSIASDQSRADLSLYFHAHLTGLFDGTAPPPNYEIEVEGVCEDSRFSARFPALFDSGRHRFRVNTPHLWWPRGRGKASLYNVVVRLLRDGKEVDRLTLTHGIRTTQLLRTSVTDSAGKGEFCFRINGEKVFILGSNWVPADACHSRDVERIPAILDMVEEIGCNMLRCWGGNVYEPDLFYDLCDQKGILIWQDFALACAVYPQDETFQNQIRQEARKVVRRLRQHPCIALWAGDNECDQAHSWGGRRLDPNTNVLTREVLPRLLQEEDTSRPYLPSSPYIDATAFATGERFLPENHLWGPRDYFKSPYYTQALCHFASEMGYHGCPVPESIAEFISPDKIWPCLDNEEWRLHSTSPIPGPDLRRVELMVNQVRELFGEVPDNLPDFSLASQISQAEALKFFVEMFRAAKWRRTGLLWWNLMDGWPQFSDAIVDYYFRKKKAFSFLQRSQSPLCLVLREPQDWNQELVACNDTRNDLAFSYTVRDADSEEIVKEGQALARADAVTSLGSIPFSASAKRCYLLDWKSEARTDRNHYISGYPPFNLDQYKRWLEKIENASGGSG